MSDKGLNKKSLAKDTYFVAVKLLLRDGNELLVTHDVFGAWDIPGGRIRYDQFTESLPSILDKKVREELGDEIQYELGDIAETFRVERNEAGLAGKRVRVFAVGFEAKYVGGKARLGDHHDKYKWINLKTVNLADYASPGGWVEQLEDYQKRFRV